MLRWATEVILVNNKELSPKLDAENKWRNSNALREKDRILRDDLISF